MKLHSLLGTLALVAGLLLSSRASAQITNALPGRSIVKLLPDYERPLVYALNQANGSVPGTLLALDATNGSVVHEIAVNLNPTDMAMSPGGGAIYVINAGSRSISKVDLNTFSVVSEKTIPTPNSYNTSNPLYLVAGQSNMVYYTDGAWGPEIYAFNYATGTNQLVLNTGGNQSIGAGGMVLNRSGNTLYIWQQYGWSAGYANSSIASLAVGSGSLTTTATGPSQSRDPLNTPIFLDAAEKRVFNKVQMVSATNVSVLLTQFPDNIYAISLDGSIAFGPTEVFNTQNGTTLTNLPFSTTIQTLSGDQQRLFRYNPATTNVVIYNMASIAPLSGPDLVPTPADGSVVSLPVTNLTWSASPSALSYDVYFGTNQALVASATPTSTQYLGRVTSPAQSLPASLQPGSTYFWRVDTDGFNATNTGAVWSFTVSTISINPSQISFSSIAGYNPPAMTLSLTSSSSVAWSATVAGSNWLSLNPGSGTSPDTVKVAFDTTNLPAGHYTNNIEFTVGALKMELPVNLDVKPLNIVKMLADQQRPYIYALQAPALSGQSGLLLFINTTNDTIEKTLPIGTDPVDLTINYGEDRLYIASWQENATYVVDLASQTLLPPLHLGTDIYKINAGRAGRIITEGEDQWVNCGIVNTAGGTNVFLSNYSLREGDGECDPTGTIYYHCDNNISDAHIHKYMITNDTLVEVAGSNQHPYGSRNLILSPDGTTLFWQGYVYDANLNELGSLGEQIYATTAHGDLALGSQHVFNSRNGKILYTWPFSTSIMAVSGDQKKVFLYNSSSNQLVTLPMSDIASVPGPGLNPTPADGSVVNPPLSQVSWTVSPFALSYRVFMGTNEAEVANADTNSSLYLGPTSSNSFPLSASVNSGATYFWRVDSVGFSSIVTGEVWSFTVSAMTVTPQTLSLSSVAGLPILPQTISLSAPLPTTWKLTVAQPWLSASATNGSTPSSVTLNFNTTNLTAGLYTNQLTLTGNGISLQLPVTLQLFDLNASKMVADPSRDYIYVLQPGGGNFSDAFLLFLNTDTGIVEKVIPVGINPTDMTINRFEDRLYISNWQHNQTQVIDLKTQTALTPLALGSDIYKINAGRAGRIVTESEDQWVTLNLFNTTDGSAISTLSWSVYEGDGEFDPSGRYYYHVESGISDASMTKYDMSADTFNSVGSVGPDNYWGSRNLVMSMDGSRLFWTTAVYDTNLNNLGTIGSEVYACSTNGAIAFSDHQAFDTATKQVIYNLPATSSVEIVDRNNQKLWYFNPATHRVENLAMSLIQSPSITQQPATNTTVGAGDNVRLTVGAMGLNPLSYQWLLSGTNLTGQTNYFLALDNIQTNQQGNYQVVVSNPHGAVTSLVAQVTVLLAPSIVQQPMNTNVLAGHKLSLSALVSGSEPMRYQWHFQGNAITDATNATLDIANAQSANEGIYDVVVANAAGSATSSIANVRVLPTAPTIIAQPVSMTASAGSNVTFQVSAMGSEPMTCRWLFKGSPVLTAPPISDSAGGPWKLFLSNVQSWNEGNYQVIVSNSVGSITSSVATLTVTLIAPYFVAQPVGASLPAGTNLFLSATAKGSEPIGYQWLHDGVQIPNAYQPSLALSSLKATDSGAYQLLAFNSAGVSTSLVATVVVTTAPPVFVQQPISVSVPLGAQFSLNSFAEGSSPMRYQWYFNDNPITNLITSSVVLHASSTNFGGAYFVVASNSFGSATSDVAQVTVTIPPSLPVVLTNQIVNTGENAILAVSATGSSPLGYSWQLNGKPIAGTDSTLIVTNIQLSQSGYYQVTVTNDYGTTSSSCRISVFGPQSRIIAWGDDSGRQTDVPTNMNDIVSVAGGDYHSLALHHNGTLTAWGYNGDGQTSLPTNSTRFVSIASGADHNLAITESGQVVAWGLNDSGQCNVPASVISALAIAAGDSHSLALLSSGAVVAWGDNTYGETSLPPSLQSGGHWGLVNGVWVWLPINPPPAKAIAAGGYHSLALLNDGTVVGWGDNSFGQATPPTGLSNVVAIAAGYLHSVALCSNRTVVAWGDNTFGQTNVPAGLTNVVAIAAGDFNTLALRADGTIVSWGDDSFGQTNVPVMATNAWAIAAGNYHGLALVPVIPSLQAEIEPAGLVIHWQGSGVLQWAPSVDGPYSDVPCNGDGYTNVDMSAPAKFFRIRR